MRTHFKVLPIWIAVVASFILQPFSARAQVASDANGVSVTLRGLEIQWGGDGESGTPSLSASVSGLNGLNVIEAQSPALETNQAAARMVPGKTYTLSSGSGDVQSFVLQAVPPPGYIMEIDGVPRERISVGGGASVRLRVRPPETASPARAGVAAALTTERTLWQVSLGSLSNGQSAGSIAFIDTDAASSVASIFRPEGLIYDPTSSEVEVLLNNAQAPAPYIPGTIRQIITPQVCVDVVITAQAQCELKFYHRSQLILNGSFPRSFSGAPFVWYFFNQKGAEPNSVRISCDTRNIWGLTEAESSFSRSKVTELVRSGEAPDYTWTAQEWRKNDEGEPSISEEVRSRSGDQETLTVAAPGAAPVSKITRTYTAKNWGKEVTAETLGTTDPITTNYTYYDNLGADSAGYAHLRSRETNGNWEAYEYYDYAAETASLAGAIRRQHRPFKDSSTSVPSDLGSHSGEITTFQYAADAFGKRTRPTSVETTVNGTTIAKMETSYSEASAGFSGHPFLYLVTATQATSTASGKTLTTTTKYFRENAGVAFGAGDDDFFRGQIHSIERPDHVKQSFVYQRGIWNGASFQPSPHAGLDVIGGVFASRISVITGNTSTGTLYIDHGGYDIDDLRLVEKKSTMEVVIRDNYARVVRTETHVWADGVWNLVASTDFKWNFANQMTERRSSNGAVYQVFYEGEVTDSEINESGVELHYGYDTANRVDTVTKSAVGDISELTTKFVYDAADRVLEEHVGWGLTGEIVTIRSFDAAGRPLTEHPAGLGTTTFSYDPPARKRTTTLPAVAGIAGDLTRVEEYYPDGQLASVTGTAVVPQFCDYFVEAGGRRAECHQGTSTSGRLQKTWTDWAGRTIRTEHPGFDQQPAVVENYTYDLGTGLLSKVERTGYAPTLYEYDELARVSRQGLLLNNAEALNPESTDRITDYEQKFEKISGSWWLKAETTTYPYHGVPGHSDGEAKRISTSLRRISGHPTGTLEETSLTDAEGNVSTATTTVDRAAATVVRTTTRPGLLNPEVETSLNGLPATATGHDGLSVSAQYDAFHRLSTTIDQRNNTTSSDYYPGTTLVKSVTDAAGKVTSFGYDALGRRTSTLNAVGDVSYLAYNARGQLLHQWGSASYPMEFGYDTTYGDRTVLTTFRGGSGWDGNTWPSADTGIRDQTVWSHDGPSGLVSKKTDAAGHEVIYEYSLRGQTSKRTSARGIVATYIYDEQTGEHTQTTYSDTTPSLSYSYTRLGQLQNTTQEVEKGGLGTRDFFYDSNAPWRVTGEDLGAFYGNRILTELYDAGTSTSGGVGTISGRAKGFQLGVAGNPGRDLQQNHIYSDLGRFTGLQTGGGAGAAREFTYGYKPDGMYDGYSSGSFSVERDYDPQRDLLVRLESKWEGAVSLTRFDYGHTDLGQRRWSKQSGSAFADYTRGTTYNGVFNFHAYDSRGQMQTTAMYRGDNPGDTPPASLDELPGRRFEYRYDNIGNRKTAGPNGTSDSGDEEYTTNNLNQYSAKENNTVHVLGTAAPGATVAASDNALVTKVDRSFAANIVPQNEAGPAHGALTIYTALVGGGPSGTDLIGKETRPWLVGKAHQDLGYDEDGNLTSDGIWDYQYDAEDRVTVMSTPAAAVSFGVPDRRLEFKYDHAGRRVQKRSVNYTANTETVTRYLYDGTNLIAELDGTGTNIQRTFTWGLDAVGSLEDTGGVGALVQIHDVAASKTFFVSCDGNGNISALVDASSGAVEAVYEYGPFGELLRAEGSYAKSNPFRFSSKFQDDESGLVYYGARFYSPEMGRFINRDPIEEAGGLNLYGFCGNDGVNGIDRLGMEPIIVMEAVYAGAEAGSSFGPVGTVVGGVIGGVASIFGLTKFFGLGGGGGAKAPPKPKVTRQETQAPNSAKYMGPANGEFFDPVTGQTSYFQNGQLVGKPTYLYDNIWIQETTGTNEFLGYTVKMPPLEVTASRLPAAAQSGFGQAALKFLGGLAKGVAVGVVAGAVISAIAIAAPAAVPVMIAIGGAAAIYSTYQWAAGGFHVTPEGAGEFIGGLAGGGVGGRLGGVLLRSGKSLLASMETGSIKYGALDTLGRPTGVQATITQDMIGTGTSAAKSIRPPGFQGQAAGQARGHLLGRQLGGSGTEVRNLVTLQQNPVNSPVMRGFENQIRAAVEEGQVFRGSFTPVYNGGNLIPRGVTIMGSGSGDFQVGVTILNPIGF